MDRLTEIALESGADDVTDDEDSFELYCKPEDLSDIKNLLQKKHIEQTESTLLYKPTQPVVLSPKDVSQVLTLIEHLDALSDVQNVYSTIA